MLRRRLMWALFPVLCVSFAHGQGAVPEKEMKTESAFFPKLSDGFRQRPEASEYVALCENVRVKNLDDLDLNDMETRLLCGDKGGDQIGKPWSSIPPNQAAFFAKGFLQSRGYHKPIFLQDDAILFLDPGPKSRLRSFRIIGGPSTWEPPRRRLIAGRELTPKLLDELEGWALLQIKNEGYACAAVESKADPATGEVVADLETGTLRYIRGVETSGDTGLREGALDRYNAFHVGDLYRENLIALTRRRVVEDGFLQTIVMSTRCESDPNGVTIIRDVTLGAARTVRVGVGGSTEEGGKVRAIVRQTRIGESASSAQLSANASYLRNDVNRQEINALYRWFYSEGEARSYIEPSVIFDHTAEPTFESQSVEAKVLHGGGWEFSEGQADLRLGPTWLDDFRTRGANAGRSAGLLGEITARYLSHNFEYFKNSPRDGTFLTMTVLLSQKKWASDFTAQKFQLQGEKLWNIYRFDPPFFVVGVRFNASSVFSPDEDVARFLPNRFLMYLGGESDLRGFSRASLPRSGVGALSGVTASFEGRLHKVILSQADFFAFIDSGILGGLRFKLDGPVFMSPGIGFRWESPVGVFRTYAAQRFALGEKPDQPSYDKAWRYGLTYGEEF